MKPVVLCILDGIGLREEVHGNAFKLAKMPTLEYLYNNFPHSKLDASGVSVGLPDKTMGNSEVGHMNIGAGKIVYQPSQFINEEIKNRNFFQNNNLLEAIELAKKNNSKLHIMGLVSDAGVHSLMDHLFSILDLAKEKGITSLYIHGFSDGRDTPPKSAVEYFGKLDKKLKELGIGSLATVTGRYYAMDRDNRWDRIKKAYDCILEGKGHCYQNFEQAIINSYEQNITDEFIEPSIIDNKGIIEENDVVIAFNFRPDRLRELLSAISNPRFDSFERNYKKVYLWTMMPVSNEVICQNLYKNQNVDMPLGVLISKNRKKQLRIAETEKYAHVTYFFDGGIERDLAGCTRILIPSPKVATYDLTPKMSAKEITDNLLTELDKDIYDLVILNYANGDMLGHTGSIKATIEGLEYLDNCIKRIYDKVKEKDGILIITSDHGNCEYMLDENDNPVTSHTTNKVPFVVCKENIRVEEGKLSDIAPTILNLMDIEVPVEMTGNNLIK